MLKLRPNDLAEGNCPPSLANCPPDHPAPNSEGSKPGFLVPL